MSMHLQTLAITINQSLIGHDRYYEAGFGAPHAPTRALRKLTRVEEFWWAVQDSNSTATPQAGQQNGPAPANSTKPGTFSGPKWLKKGSGFLILRYSFVQAAIAFLFCNSPSFLFPEILFSGIGFHAVLGGVVIFHQGDVVFRVVAECCLPGRSRSSG